MNLTSVSLVDVKAEFSEHKKAKEEAYEKQRHKERIEREAGDVERIRNVGGEQHAAPPMDDTM